MRVGMDCGKRVLVLAKRVGRGQDVEHVKEAGDLAAAQQGQQEDEAEGRGATANNEQHVQTEEETEKGKKRKPEPWNRVRLVGMWHQELEGQKGMVEEIYKDKVQVLLVGGVHRVKVDKTWSGSKWSQWKFCP